MRWGQANGETLLTFRQKVSVFSKWARHRGDVGNSTGFTSDFGKFGVGPFNWDPPLPEHVANFSIVCPEQRVEDTKNTTFLWEE
ncbi:hypothetical protein L3X38_027405 [Prunus dulcis]|uniref:Uncharacterized protein n=1 Tax=Prunus dulcis TaxID=3755 RepID=A0AAD4VPD2_PRUDU|nr:hypothetical protein L3X38_027405 [Prunus dulcis]